MSYTQFVIDFDNMIKNFENTFAGFHTLPSLNTSKILDKIEKVNVPNIPFDIYKSDKEVLINVAIPGKTKDMVSITSERINGVNYLKIDVKEDSPKKDEDLKEVFKKIKDISGSINIKIGDSYKLKDLSASFENGLLSITIPKKSEEEIKSAIKTYTIK